MQTDSLPAEPQKKPIMGEREAEREEGDECKGKERKGEESKGKEKKGIKRQGNHQNRNISTSISLK